MSISYVDLKTKMGKVKVFPHQLELQCFEMIAKPKLHMLFNIGDESVSLGVETILAA